MELSVFEAIRALRSMRRLKPDPVETDKVHTILEAAGKLHPEATHNHGNSSS